MRWLECHCARAVFASPFARVPPTVGLAGTFGYPQIHQMHPLHFPRCVDRIHLNHSPVRHIWDPTPISHGKNLLNQALWFDKHLMLPIAKHPPTSRFKAGGLPGIPLHISPELRGPESSPATGPNVVVWTTMPKATIHIDGHTGTHKYKVGTTGYRPVVHSIARTFTPEHLSKQPLRLGVPTLNPPHKG